MASLAGANRRTTLSKLNRRVFFGGEHLSCYLMGLLRLVRQLETAVHG